MRHPRLTLASAALWLVVHPAWAETAVPYNFSAGSPARAAEVNANFQAVAAAINNTDSALANLTGQDAAFSQDLSVGGDLAVTGSIAAGGEAQLRIVNAVTEPATGASGALYFNTATDQLMVSDGTVWRSTTRSNRGFVSGSGMDSTTSGAVSSRRLEYTKKSATSDIRITYSDNLMLNAAAGTGAIWSIYVDDSVVESPHMLFTSLYSSTAQVLQVPGVIRGVISGLDAGPHTFQIYITHVGSPNVTRCMGSFSIEVEEIDSQ